MTLYLIITLTSGFLAASSSSLGWQVIGLDNPIRSHVLHYLSENQSLIQELPENQQSLFIINQIKKIMQPYGYYTPNVRLQGQNVHIDKGQTVTIASIELHLPAELKQTDLQADMQTLIATQQHATLTHFDYDMLKSTLNKKVQNMGYLHAHCDDSYVSVNTKKRQAAIHLIVQPGVRYTFGQIRAPHIPYHLSLLERFGDIQRHTPFSQDKLDEMRRHLLQSGLFQAIYLQTSLQEKSHSVDIEIQGQLSKPYSYALGFGINRVGQINLSMRSGINYITAYADRANLQFELSLDKNREQRLPKSASVSYTFPGYNPVTDFFGLKWAWASEQPAASSISNSWNLSLYYQRKKRQENYDAALNLERESEQIDEEQTRHHQMTYGSVEAIRTDCVPTWLDKIRLRGKLSYGLQQLGDPEQFLRVRAGYRLEKKWAPLILHQDASVGLLLTENLDSVASSARFYAGGAYSVRGYNYHSLGPAKSLFLLSHELILPLTPLYGAGLFHDSAWLHGDDRLYQSVGVVASLFLPVGTLQLSLGTALGESKKTMVQLRLLPDLENIQ